jgi:hypothetical protein
LDSLRYDLRMTTVRSRVEQTWRGCARIYWRIERDLGGLEAPSRLQQIAARRPLAVAVWTATLVTAILALGNLDNLHTIADAIPLVLGGLAFSLLFGLTALGERARQRRLQRMGLWNPPAGN